MAGFFGIDRVKLHMAGVSSHVWSVEEIVASLD
jgi:hypothetical protein